MELAKVTALMRATVLEAAILSGRLVLYPSGVVPERSAPARPGADAVPVAGGGGRPVVLLHGFADNRSVFVLLRRTLARHGRAHVVSLDHSPFTRDLRTAAEALGRRVEEVLERTGRTEADLVGHSLGGLIARYYVQRLGGDARVRTVVTLGTPHAGTTVAPLADAHPLVRQMRPGSEVLRELAGPAPGFRTRFVSFWSDLDQIMVPVETARLDHPDLRVHNVRVSGIGHLALPVHPTVAVGILAALDDGGVAADSMQGTDSTQGTDSAEGTDSAQGPDSAEGAASVA
ncbi:esterase/lipase family protein [Streptomyces filamentosus]|uniref:esterase/lipase family protein n=1 Tax=Streptomyces filamentosus TaxID=67294 RepID=UPI0036E0039F